MQLIITDPLTQNLLGLHALPFQYSTIFPIQNSQLQNKHRTSNPMCVVWIVKYNICGCICEKESIYCPEFQSCWGARGIIFHSNLQTCQECWDRGDKRVNRSFAKLLNGFTNTGSERRQQQDRHAEINVNGRKRRERESTKGSQADGYNTDAESHGNIENHKSNQDDINVRNENRRVENESHPSSRPSYPVENLNRDFDPDHIPSWLLSIQQNCDLTRVCDPVPISYSTRNQRVRRGRTDWYALKRKFSLIVVCSP